MYAKLGNMSNDDQELWHSNGEELSMSYEEGLTQTQLEDKLKSASKTGNKADYGLGCLVSQGISGKPVDHCCL